MRAAGLEKYFDMVLSVEDVGIYKPSRRIYRHAMQKLQIQDAPAMQPASEPASASPETVH